MYLFYSFFVYLAAIFTFSSLEALDFNNPQTLQQEKSNFSYQNFYNLHENEKELVKEYITNLKLYNDLQTYHINICNTTTALEFNTNYLFNNDTNNDQYNDPFKSNFLFLKGTTLNNMLLYSEAINVLTDAIKYNSSNKDIYIERARAYFETNQITLALQDYAKVKLLIIPPLINTDYINRQAKIYIPENKTEFSRGLITGVLFGAKISSQELLPSLFSCMRGLLNGLWAFTCSPAEVSCDFANAAYSIGEFIYHHNTEECLQCVVPELKELSISWNSFNDYNKGEKIGFIIGKYGIDIFAPVALVKGVSKITALKRANTMLTLECCAKSNTKQIKILEESSKHAALRTTVISETIKNNKIIIKSSNAKHHIMQKKHAWDKVVILTGDLESDFKTVISFLEEKNIINPNNLKNTTPYPQHTPIAKINILEYEAIVNGHKLEIFLEKYLDTGETFLKNGWIVTK